MFYDFKSPVYPQSSPSYVELKFHDSRPLGDNQTPRGHETLRFFRNKKASLTYSFLVVQSYFLVKCLKFHLIFP